MCQIRSRCRINSHGSEAPRCCSWVHSPSWLPALSALRAVLTPLAWAAIFGAIFPCPFTSSSKRASAVCGRVHEHGAVRAHHRGAVRPHRHGIRRRSHAALASVDLAAAARAGSSACSARGAGCAPAVRTGHPQSRRRPEDGRWRGSRGWSPRAPACCAQHRYLVVNVIIMLFALFSSFATATPSWAGCAGPAVRSVRFVKGASANCRAHQGEHQLGHHRRARAGAVGGITFRVSRPGAPVFWGVIMAFFSRCCLSRLDCVAAGRGVAAADRRDWPRVSLMIIGAGGIT